MIAFNQRLCVLIVLLVLADVTRSDTSLPDGKTTTNVEQDDAYHSPQRNSIGINFAEHFDDEESFQQRWVQSVDSNYEGKWEIQSPLRNILKNDSGLVLVSEGKHAAISALLDKPFEFKHKWLIVQYEVTFQEDQECGGAYIMLLSQDAKTKAELRMFNDQSPYTILFGPDKCGNNNDLHFIFRYKNPKDSTIEKKYTKKISQGLEYIYGDKEPHLYTLIIRPDNFYMILIDNSPVVYESFPEDFTPGKKDDPNLTKMDKWAEMEECMRSDTSTAYIHCFKKNRFNPILPVYAVGFELWAMTPMILFDNVLITDDPAISQQWVKQTFALKRHKILKSTNKNNRWDFENPAMELIAVNNEYLLEHGLKYVGVVLGSFIFMGIITYICCGRKSGKRKQIMQNLDVTIEKTDANMEFTITNIHEKIDGKWTEDPQESEVDADSNIKEEVEHNTHYKSEIINKEKSEKPEPERIITDGKLSEGEQKQWAVNPWVYAGVIVGSFISVGVATYIWSGHKSESNAKTKKDDAVMEDDSRYSKSEARENERSIRTKSGKTALEEQYTQRIANNSNESDGIKRIKITDDEEESRSNSPSEDVRWREECGNSVIKRPTRVGI